MRVIFLDIDGVLNTGAFLSRCSFDRPEEAIDPSAVALLNEIVRASGARIVISSSWRCTFSLHELREILELVGLQAEIIDATPRVSLARGHEILLWLDTQDPRPDYVVLDDDTSGMDLHTGKYVRTEFEFGMQPHHVIEALQIFGLPMDDS